MKRKKLHIGLGILVGIGVLIVLGYLFQDPLRLMIGNYLIVQDPLESADVIHVISGMDYRTNYAIQLYKEGYGKTLFYTGSWCDKIQAVHADHAKEISIEAGVPPEAIATDGTPIISTYEEAERLKAFIYSSPQPIKSVIIVSAPFHMRRARWAYRRVLGKEIKVIMAPVPFEQTSFKRQWWLDNESKDFVNEEYKKLIYYVLRYQLSSGELKDWLASFDTN